MSNKSRHVKLLKLAECFRSRKKIEKREHAGYGINLLATLRAHFYTGNSICLYRATCGAIPGFEKSQSGKYSEIRDFGQGEFPLAAQVPIPNKEFVTEYFRYRHIK